MNYKIMFFVTLATLAAVGIFSIVQVSLVAGLRGELADAVEEANETQTEAEDELSELEAKLTKAQRDLRGMRRAQKEAARAMTLEEALASGNAENVAGLAADVSIFDCINRSCNSIQGTATFKNDTQQGSAVTCLFKVEFEDGSTSHFSWFAEYVPPKGESVSDLYFTSNHPSPADFWYDSEDCYRGIATFNPGMGDI